MEEAIIEEHDAGVVNKEPIDKERKLISEEDSAAIIAEENDPAAIVKE